MSLETIEGHEVERRVKEFQKEIVPKPTKSPFVHPNSFDILTEEDEEFPTCSEAKTDKIPVAKMPRGKFPRISSTKRAEAKADKREDVRCKTVDLHFLDSVSNMINAVESNSDYYEMETVLDSGATASVISKEEAPAVAIQESPGSRSGQVFSSASGGKMPNQGQKSLNVVTDEGHNFGMVYQVADVAKGLTSVGHICDAADGNNFVVFTRTGGYIASPSTGCTTAFSRKDKGGAYLLRT